MKTFFVIIFFLSLFNLNSENIPEVPFSFDKNTVLLFHFNRGPNARSGFPSGPEGKIKGCTWVLKGKFGACLFFNGKKDCVEVVLNEKILPERIVEMWIKPEKDEKNLRIIYHEVESPGCNSLFILQPDGRIRYQRIYCGIEKDTIVSKSKVVFNKWNYIAFKIDGRKDRIEFLINEEKEGPYDALIADSVSRIGIGGQVEGEKTSFLSFYGYIDEIRIKRVNSEDQYNRDTNYTYFYLTGKKFNGIHWNKLEDG